CWPSACGKAGENTGAATGRAAARGAPGFAGDAGTPGVAVAMSPEAEAPVGPSIPGVWPDGSSAIDARADMACTPVGAGAAGSAGPPRAAAPVRVAATPEVGAASVAASLGPVRPAAVGRRVARPTPSRAPAAAPVPGSGGVAGVVATLPGGVAAASASTGLEA